MPPFNVSLGAHHMLVQVSEHAQSFIRCLLRHNTSARLGTKGGLKEVLSHPWLAEVDINARLMRPG
jgi:hypothetical protein